MGGCQLGSQEWQNPSLHLLTSVVLEGLIMRLEAHAPHWCDFSKCPGEINDYKGMQSTITQYLIIT